MENQISLTKNALLDVAKKEKSRQLFSVIFLLILAVISCGGFLYTLSRSTVVSMILLLLGVIALVIAVKQLLRFRKNHAVELVQAEQFQVLELPVIHKDEGRSGDVSFYELSFPLGIKDFVPKSEYQRAEIGNLYYVVRLEEENRILRSFAAKHYRPAETLLPYVSQPQLESTDLI